MLSFGIKTVPARSTYQEILAVWQEADEIPEIEHAWLWDHLVPLRGDPATPMFEGWTLLSALAARTERIRFGLMVASNRIRPPAVLAKMAASLDVISGGRLVFGVGVGATALPGRTDQELADREFGAYGLELVAPAVGIAALDEACTLTRRLWTEDAVDFDGEHYRLRGGVCSPKPVQRPGPPVLIGAWGRRALAVVARHADLWNVPGPPHRAVDDVRERRAVLDAHCAAIGRDPAEIVTSTQTVVDPADPAGTRATVAELVDAGARHLVLGVPAPYPRGVVRRLVDEVVRPVQETVGLSN